ncbi:MAG: phosphate ABC transporter substrate-binding protein [Clostridia bacterium]|nr:phosphate ABC transporter substrate-binding protein [Clostridia bacterium]
MKRSFRILMIAILAAAMFAFSACEQTPIFDDPVEVAEQGAGGQETLPPIGDDGELKGTIEIIGSTSVQPLAEELAREFMKANPDIVVNVQGGGSSVGVTSAINGICDIGTASRSLKETEKGAGLTEHIAALDGIAVVVHPNNSVSDLSAEQVKQIYMGEITNWSEVGGADKPIIVFNREAASGTRGAFIELAKLEEKRDDGSKRLLITSEALEANSNGALKTNVSTKEGAIGYVSMGTIDDTIKAVSIGGVQATAGNVIDGTYTLYRPFLMLTSGQPNAITRAFLEFVKSEAGQEIASQDYISAN